MILSEYVLGYPVEWWGRRKTTVNVWDWIYFIFILYLWRMLLLLSVEMLLMPFHVLFLEISFLIDRADDIYLLQLSPLLQLYFEDILASLSTWNHSTHAWSLSKYWTARTKKLVIIRSIFYTLPCIKKSQKSVIINFSQCGDTFLFKYLPCWTWDETHRVNHIIQVSCLCT